jgi:hypothetical protein
MVGTRWMIAAAAVIAIVIISSTFVMWSLRPGAVGTPTANPYEYTGPWTPPGSNESVNVSLGASESNPTMVHFGPLTFGLWWESYRGFLEGWYSSSGNGTRGNFSVIPVSCPTGHVAIPACNGGPEMWESFDGQLGVWVLPPPMQPVVYVWAK